MTEGNEGETNPSQAPTKSVKGQAAVLWAAWWPVLRAMLSLLRRHGLRLFLLAFLLSLVSFGPSLVLVVPATVLQRFGIYVTLDGWPAALAFGAAITAVIGPAEAGYPLIVYRLLHGENGGVRTLFAGYSSGRLYCHLAIVSVLLFAGQYGLNWLWFYLPWDFCWEYFYNIVAPSSPVDELIASTSACGLFIGKFHFAAKTLILLPIQWALLEVIVGGKSWPKALAGSACLVWLHKRLCLLMLCVLLVLSFDPWLRALLPHRQDYFDGYSQFVYWLVDYGSLGGHAAITCAISTVNAAALVVIYDAMLRPAPARSPESA